MAKEYYFSLIPQLGFPLDEAFEVSSDITDTQFLVANVKSVNAEIYAHEVNFYLSKSEDEIRQKIRNIKTLYDIRATAFDAAQDVESSAEVGQKLLIISRENQESLRKEFGDSGFSSTLLDPLEVEGVDGSIGKLRVSVKNRREKRFFEADQIVWFGASQALMGRSGIYDPEAIGREEVVEKVKANSGTYSFRNHVKYNPSICQYHQKRNEICGKCADICQTNGISKNISEKHLEISDIDCNGCGRCVSVCPSGALDYAPTPRASFKRISAFYVDKIALVISGEIDLEKWHIRLKEDVLPLIIENPEFLDECHFLSFLQTTGNPIILYTASTSEILENCISIINEIFHRKYNKQAIFKCNDEMELSAVFEKVSPIPNSVFQLNEKGMKKREIFSARLAHIVDENDFGIVSTGPQIHYGDMAITQDRCTLCLSCADACNIGALTAHPEDNTLRFNPSFCTSCGYCEITCPEENCLHILHDQLSLHPDYFKNKVMAHDEIFKCAECGVGFAPAKSIRKITDIMTPLFGHDPVKIKTLSCCSDCKARIMLESQSFGSVNR